MSKKGLFLLFFSVFISFSASSQDYNSYSFNELYGFDVNTVYDIFQDHEANMWFGSSEGLVKFNGVDCKFYSHENYSKSYSNIKEDNQGRIWFSNFGGQLFFIENDEVHIAIKQSSQNRFISEYLVDFPNVIFTESKGSELRKVNLNTGSTSVLFSSNKGVIKAADASEEKLVFVEQAGSMGKDVTILRFMEYSKSTNTVREVLHSSLQLISSKHQLTIDGDSFYYMRTNKVLEYYKIENNKLIKIIESNLADENAMNQVDLCDGQIHALTKKGFYSFGMDGVLINTNPHFENSSISGIYMDRESNWWVSTLNDGLLIVTNRKLKSAKISNSEIVNSCKDGNAIIYYVNREGEFYQLKPPYVVPELIDDKRMSLGKKIIFNSFDACIYFQGESIVYNTKLNSFFPIPNRVEAVNFRDIAFFDKSVGLLCSFDITVIENLEGNDLGRETPQYPFEREVEPNLKILKRANAYHAVLEENKIDLYVSYLNDLFHYFDGGKKILKFKGSSILVSSMVKIEGGGVWVGTKDNYLLRIERGKIIKTYFVGSHFDGILDHRSFVFLWSKDQIIRCNTSNKEIVVLDRTDGLLKDKIVNVTLLNEELIVVGRNSIQKIPVEYDWKNTIAPFLRIESILLFENPIQRKELTFGYDENNITINFSATSVRSQSRCVYRYRLNREDWIETTTDAPFARFSQLAPGDYLFEVQSLNEDGVKSDIKTVEFTIDVHFTRKWWFIGLFLVLISGTVYWLVKYRINLIRKQVEIKEEQQQIRKELYKSKITAIRSQMNPHFMFNALNTIQEFIMTNKKEVASEYLADFADLMRRYLDQSRKEEIYLSEEIETLEIYLGLENLRADGNFHYSINCEPKLNPYEIKIPVMLLQPFIENSIKHGLLHRSGDKQLSINFHLISENRLECSIEDNGIGRQASAEIKRNRKSKHSSFSTDAIDEKIQMVNENTSRKLSVNVEDLFDGSTPIGTLVKIEVDI